MCGRYRLSRRKQLIEEYFETTESEHEWASRYNIAPTQLVPVIRQNPKEPVRELSLARWGLIPSWAKDSSGAARMINARSETAGSTPAFRDARAEGFGKVEQSHYVFAAFVPKFTFSGKKVIDYNVTGFDPTRHVNSWRTAWRTLTKKAGLPGFRFHDLRHCAITQLAESGTSDSTIMAIAGHVSRRMLERYSHVRMEAKRTAMEALAVSTKTAGYDTSHDTNVALARIRPV